MEFRTTSTPNKRGRRGMTLIETTIALGLSVVIMTAVMSFTSFAARSFAAIGNYCAMDIEGRTALDLISRDIRQADFLSSYNSKSLVFQLTDPVSGIQSTLTYAYSPGQKTLTRTFNGQSAILLHRCTDWDFTLHQRNPTLNLGGDLVPLLNTNQPGLVKAIDLSWTCSREILGKKQNSESIQSARIVIRKN